MEVQLTPDQNEFVLLAIQSGRYRRAEDVVGDALVQWAEAERSRVELVALIHEAQEDFAWGEDRVYTDETLPLLAEELMREGRANRDARELFAGIASAEADPESGCYRDYTNETSALLKAELNAEGRALLKTRLATRLPPSPSGDRPFGV